MFEDQPSTARDLRALWRDRLGTPTPGLGRGTNGALARTEAREKFQKHYERTNQVFENNRKRWSEPTKSLKIRHLPVPTNQIYENRAVALSSMGENRTYSDGAKSDTVGSQPDLVFTPFVIVRAQIRVENATNEPSILLKAKEGVFGTQYAPESQRLS